MILRIGSEEHQQEFHLHFHTQEAESDEERAKKNLQPLLWSHITTCYVHTGPCVWTFAAPKYCINGTPGSSKCSKQDQFLRAVGAKKALARAIKGLSEDIRKQIWDAYWLRVRRPKERSDKFRKRIQQTQKAA